MQPIGTMLRRTSHQVRRQQELLALHARKATTSFASETRSVSREIASAVRGEADAWTKYVRDTTAELTGALKPNSLERTVLVRASSRAPRARRAASRAYPGHRDTPRQAREGATDVNRRAQAAREAPVARRTRPLAPGCRKVVRLPARLVAGHHVGGPSLSPVPAEASPGTAVRRGRGPAADSPLRGRLQVVPAGCAGPPGMNLVIERGELVFFTGASGAGKSTLLWRLLYRAETVD